MLKATREKWQHTRELPSGYQLISQQKLQARREWHDIFKVMKGKKLQPRLLYPARLSFRFIGEIKSFPDKQKLREFSTTKLALVVAQMIKHLPTMRETRVQSLGQEYLLEKEMATHSSTLAWKIPWTVEPGRLQSMGWQRIGHDWATSMSMSLSNQLYNKC